MMVVKQELNQNFHTQKVDRGSSEQPCSIEKEAEIYLEKVRPKCLSIKYCDRVGLNIAPPKAAHFYINRLAASSLN